MDKPRPVLTHSPPLAIPPPSAPDFVRHMVEGQLLATVKEQAHALELWNTYFSEYRETAVNDTDGDVYIVLAKDVREEPVGLCPFLLRVRKVSGQWKGSEGPGAVLFEDEKGKLSSIIPTYEGEKINVLPPPMFSISPEMSTWHVHKRKNGVLKEVHILVSEEEPEVEKGDSVVKIATFKQTGKRFWVETHCGGTYVLHKTDGGSSSSSSSSSNSSSSGSSSSRSHGSSSGSSSGSKTAIIQVGDEYIGWFATERPDARFEDVATVPLTGTEGLWFVPPEAVGSIRAGTFQCTSVKCDGLVAATAEIILLGEQVLIGVTIADVGHGLATEAVVRYEGVSIESPEPWKRFTEAQYLSNLAFYRSAHGDPPDRPNAEPRPECELECW